MAGAAARPAEPAGPGEQGVKTAEPQGWQGFDSWVDDDTPLPAPPTPLTFVDPPPDDEAPPPVSTAAPVAPAAVSDFVDKPADALPLPVAAAGSARAATTRSQPPRASAATAHGGRRAAAAVELIGVSVLVGVLVAALIALALFLAGVALRQAVG